MACLEFIENLFSGTIISACYFIFVTNFWTLIFHVFKLQARQRKSGNPVNYVVPFVVSLFPPLSVEITSWLSFRVRRLTSLSLSLSRSRAAISRGGQIKICIKMLRDHLWHVGEREMARDCRLQDFLISHHFLGLYWARNLIITCHGLRETK